MLFHFSFFFLLVGFQRDAVIVIANTTVVGIYPSLHFDRMWHKVSLMRSAHTCTYEPVTLVLVSTSPPSDARLENQTLSPLWRTDSTHWSRRLRNDTARDIHAYFRHNGSIVTSSNPMSLLEKLRESHTE